MDTFEIIIHIQNKRNISYEKSNMFEYMNKLDGAVFLDRAKDSIRYFLLLSIWITKNGYD